MGSNQDHISYNGPPYPDSTPRVIVSEHTISTIQPEREGRRPRTKVVRPWPCNFCKPTRTFGSQKTLVAHMPRHVLGKNPILVHTNPRVIETLERNSRARPGTPTELCSVCLGFHHGTPFYRCEMLRDLKAGRKRLNPGSCPLCLRLLTLHKPGKICWWIGNKLGYWKNIRCRFHHQTNYKICRECHEKDPTIGNCLVDGIKFGTSQPEFSEEPTHHTLWDTAAHSHLPGVRPTLYNPIRTGKPGPNGTRPSGTIKLASLAVSRPLSGIPADLKELFNSVDFIHPIHSCCAVRHGGHGTPMSINPEDLPWWDGEDLSPILDTYCPWDESIFEDAFTSLSR